LLLLPCSWITLCLGTLLICLYGDYRAHRTPALPHCPFLPCPLNSRAIVVPLNPYVVTGIAYTFAITLPYYPLHTFIHLYITIYLYLFPIPFDCIHLIQFPLYIVHLHSHIVPTYGIPSISIHSADIPSLYLIYCPCIHCHLPCLPLPLPCHTLPLPCCLYLCRCDAICIMPVAPRYLADVDCLRPGYRYGYLRYFTTPVTCPGCATFAPGLPPRIYLQLPCLYGLNVAGHCTDAFVTDVLNHSATFCRTVGERCRTFIARPYNY